MRRYCPLAGRHSSLAALLITVGLCVPLRAAPLIQTPSVGSEDQDAALELDEPLEPLTPKDDRTPADEDRIAAVSQFAAGRMLEQQGDLAGALRRYERSFRLDPSALPVVREIVQLAFGLGRTEEAVRYALKSVELDPEADPELVERLADHLTSRGEFADALKLKRRAISLVGAESHSLEHAALSRDLAELLLATDDLPGAAAALDVVTAALAGRDGWQLNPDERHELLGQKPSEFWSRVGQIYLEAERWDAAQAAFDEAQAASADEPLGHYRRAQVLAGRGDAAEALAELEQALVAPLSEGGTGPYELLADLLTKLERASDIVPRLTELSRQAPTNLPLGYVLAARHLAAGQAAEAEALYRELVVQLPASEGLENLADLYFQARKWNDLIGLLGTCLAERGDLEVLGPTLTKLGDDETARTELYNAGRARLTEMAGDPLTLDQRVGLGLAALAIKQPVEAGEFFRAALAVATPDDKPLVYLRWGFGLLEQDAYGEAAEVFARAVDDADVPQDTPDFRFHLAGALEMTGRTEEALAAARRAVEVAEARADELGDKLYRLYPRVPWILHHAKRHTEAQAAYAELISRFDNVYNVPAAREMIRDARFAVSNLAVLTGDLPAAEEELEQILDEYPDDVAAANDLGYLWADQNKLLHRALPLVEYAVSVQPDNKAYRDSLGWVYFRLGRFAEAVAELEQAAQGDEVDGVIFDHLGDAYAQVGRLEEARTAWRRAAEALREAGESAKADGAAAKADAPPPPAAPSP